jgi:hypothetical protein
VCCTGKLESGSCKEVEVYIYIYLLLLLPMAFHFSTSRGVYIYIYINSAIEPNYKTKRLVFWVVKPCQFGESPVFWRKILPSSSRLKSKPSMKTAEAGNKLLAVWLTF